MWLDLTNQSQLRARLRMHFLYVRFIIVLFLVSVNLYLLCKGGQCKEHCINKKETKKV